MTGGATAMAFFKSEGSLIWNDAFKSLQEGHMGFFTSLLRHSAKKHHDL